MKSEQEFLSSMWDEISEIEYEARWNQFAKEKGRKLVYRTVAIYAIIVALCGIGILIVPLLQINYIYFAFSILLVVFFMEHIILNYGGNLNENRYKY